MRTTTKQFLRANMPIFAMGALIPCVIVFGAYLQNRVQEISGDGAAMAVVMLYGTVASCGLLAYSWWAFGYSDKHHPLYE